MLGREVEIDEDSGGRYGDGKRGMSEHEEERVLYGIC